ncbi:MAG: oligosaccharide flippase family protein [Planctomycetes bacterium]|nr:oligosaccharide flippase family protein [Planctomycetota bacterium]
MRNVFYIFFSDFGSKFLAFAISLYIRRILGPSFAGALAFVNLFVFYLNVLYGIFRNSLDREVPIAEGNGQIQMAQDLHAMVYWVILALTTLSSLIFIWGSVHYWNNVELRYAFLIGISLNAIGSISTYLRISFKVSRNFKALSLHGLVISVFSQIAYLIGVLSLNIAGYAISGLIAVGVIVFYYLKVYRLRPISAVNLNNIKVILSSGIPLSIYSFIILGLTTVDRLFIIYYFDQKSLGYYALGLLFSAVLVMLPAAMSTTILMPKWFQWAAKEQWDKLRLSILRSTFVALFFTAAACQVLIWIFPFLIEQVLPDFKESVGCSKILILTVYWTFMFQPFSVILSANAKYFRLIVCGIVAIVVGVIANYMMVRYGIEGIALATLITLFVFSNIVFVVSLCSINCGFSQILYWGVLINSFGFVLLFVSYTKITLGLLFSLPLLLVLFVKDRLFLRDYMHDIR